MRVSLCTRDLSSYLPMGSYLAPRRAARRAFKAFVCADMYGARLWGRRHTQENRLRVGVIYVTWIGGTAMVRASSTTWLDCMDGLYGLQHMILELEIQHCVCRSTSFRAYRENCLYSMAGASSVQKKKKVSENGCRSMTGSTCAGRGKTIHTLVITTLR